MSQAEALSRTELQREVERLQREVEHLRARAYAPHPSLGAGTAPPCPIPMDRMFNDLIEHLPLGWCCVDRQFRYVRINRALAAINRQPLEAHIGRTIRQIIPHAADLAERWVEQVFRTGQPMFNVEMLDLLDEHNQPLNVLVSLYPVRDENGAVQWVAASVLDVTTYRRQEQALRRGEAEFRAIFEHSGVPKALAEFGTGRLVRVNPRFCEMTGYTAEELAQMTFRDLTHPDDREREWERYSEVICGRRDSCESQMRYVRKDGTIIWVHANSRLVRNVLGVPQGSVAVVQDITARKIAEEALRQSEQRLRVAQRAAELCPWEWDLRSGVIDWSPEMLTLFGVEPSESISTDEALKRFVHPHDAPRVMQRLQQVQASGEHYQDEFRIVSADGQVRWLASYALVQRDGLGQAVTMTGVNMDVTVRKEAELAARDSAEQLKLALEAAGLGDWSWRLSDDAITLSERGCAMHGLPPGAVISSAQLFQRVHPDDAARVHEAIRRAMEHEEDYASEYRVLLPDGGVRWIADRGRAQYDESGRCTGMRGVIQDITEQRRAEQTLRDTAERLVMAQRAARAGTWEWDIATGQVTWTEEYFRLMGLDPQVDHPSHELFLQTILPEDRQRIESELAQMIHQRSRDIRLEFRIQHPRLGLRWIVSMGRVIMQDDQPVRMSGICIDMTERKQGEEQLRAAKEEAEQARRQAESASQAKDHFLAQLSHELRTPLTPVLMTAQALEEDAALPPELRPDVEMIKRNVELEARLIDDLLDLTRIARGKIELHREVCDMHGLMEHALRTCMDDTVRQKQLHICTELQAAQRQAWADPARMQQVFWNIIKNAIKFTGPGGFITIRSANPAPQVLRVEVIDSGVGIPTDSLSDIFRAFEQGGVNVTRRFGGLGLGLAICKALVQMHGGVITAHSRGPGTGATFRVELPALVEKPDVHPPESSDRPEPPEGRRRRLRVLLVEDHESTARVLKRLLANERYTILTASNIRSALALAQRENFDLLVSDLGLPDGSGLQLMAELRKRHPALRGIAVSGYGMEEDLRRSAEAGFTRHLVKPVNFQTLREVIDEVTRDTSPQDGLTSSTA